MDGSRAPPPELDDFGAVSVTVTDWAAVAPLALVQVNVYVLVAVTVTLSPPVPVAALLPLQPPLAVQLTVLVVVQFNCTAGPEVADDALAVKVTVGG